MKFLKLLGKILLVAFAFIGVVIVLVAIFVPRNGADTSSEKQVEATDVGEPESSVKQAEAKDAGKIASSAKRINSSEICRGKDAKLPPDLALPLHAAASFNACETAARMIADGADINARDKNLGDTPLHKAAKSNAVEIALLLIETGLDVNVLGKYGHTPLHMSAAYNATETAELLIARGADVNTIDSLYNRTPLDEALSGQSDEENMKKLGAGGDPDKYKKMIALLRANGGKCNKDCP